MRFEEFQLEFCRAQLKVTEAGPYPGYSAFEFIQARPSELNELETQLEIVLPNPYKLYMQQYGGGTFLYLDLLPVKSPNVRMDDLMIVNGQRSASDQFVAIAPGGTGDYWGFVTIAGVCEESVSFRDHEDGSISSVSSGFLEFLIEIGLSPR